MNPCQVCNKTDEQKPTIFRGEKWCSESHRKLIVGDTPPKRY